MDIAFLESIQVIFPDDREFIGQLFNLLGRLGSYQEDRFEFACSSPEYFPKLQIKTDRKLLGVRVDFEISDGRVFSEKVVNDTGIEKRSPHSYQPVNIDDVATRLYSAGFPFAALDHLGFNLPWFASPLHPRIANLRATLSPLCLYHHFPTGEAWDFILPGDCDEIRRLKEIDYTLIRKPKFEIVSFEKASTPLVQIDVGVQARYDEFAGLFPEALKDPQFGNIWVYLENRFTIDVCLVINPLSAGDWSHFFKGSRL
jgi:hypothetical protein